MGSPPISHVYFLKVLEQDPDSVRWSTPREVIIGKGSSGKLGIKLNSFRGESDWYSIVTKVKEDCRIHKGLLNVFDRLISVDNKSILHSPKDIVLKKLQNLHGSRIVLTVACPVEIPCHSISTQHVNINEHRNCTGSLEKFTKQDTNAENFNLLDSDGLGKEHHITSVSQDIDLNIFGSDLREERLLDRNKRCDSQKETTFTESDQSDNRLSNESESSLTWFSDSDLKDGFRNIKRGHSQVSGSSSNQSVSSDLPLLLGNDRMRRVKEGKSVRPLFKAGSTESPDRAELEPLNIRSSDSLSPVPHCRTEKFNLSPQLCISKDSAVSIQDIMVEEQGSVPVQSGHLSNCQCQNCANTSESKVSYSCGTKPSSSPKKTTSPGVSLFIDAKEPLSEDYGNFLLKNPHLAVWDGMNTHVVEIDKGHTKEFGFAFKVKIGKNQDTSVEVYTLVKSVDKGGPAVGKLRTGDWIRSVNGTPIQNHQDAFGLITEAGNSSTMRLVIQRPVGFSQHPNSIRADKSDTYVHVTRSPSPSQNTLSLGRKEQDPLIPGIIESKKEPQKIVRQQNIYFSDMSLSNNESDSGIVPFPRNVKFPKVRIFVCGSEAEKYVNLLLLASEIETVFQNSEYTHVEFSMATNCFGNLVISKICSDLYGASKHLKSHLSEVNQTNASGAMDVKCKQCGNDSYSEASAYAVSTVVNVDLFVVPDDKLFNSCCSYLFTKSSLFILTFDGDKILRASQQEFSRLQNLSHTIRSFAGEECHIMLYGLLESGAEANNRLDEVSALFYMPFSTQLQNLNVSGPELVNLHGLTTKHTSVHLSHSFQSLLWKTVTDTIQRQHVLQPSLLVVDCLGGIRDKDLIQTEEQFMSVIKSRLPDYKLDIHQMIVTYLNTFGEILLGKATPYFSQGIYSIENQVILNPKFLLGSLYHIISVIYDDRQSWSRTLCTGFLSKSELISLTGFSENGPLCKNLIDFWECNGLIFRKRQSEEGDVDFFIPYFSQVPSSNEVPVAGKKDLELYLQFSEHESSQTYYQVVFTLAGMSQNSDSFVIQGSNCASFTYKGYLITAFHQKMEDRIKFIFSREDKGVGVKPYELYKWINDTCNRCLECQFTLGSACPLGELCHRNTVTGLHLINLKDCRPQYCGNDRVDTAKTIRVWKRKDMEISPESVMSQKMSEPAKQPVLVMHLPWSVFHMLCLKLKVPSEFGRDWKGFASLLEYSTEKVHVYETFNDPVKELLRDWARSTNATIENLFSLLLQLERVDIVSDIQQALPHLAHGNSTCQSLCDDTPPADLRPISNITVCEYEYEGRENELIPHVVPIGNINVTEKGVTNLGTEENLGASSKLNNLDSNNQVDTVTGIGTEVMITPVETPGRTSSLQQS